jgi:hypothetical protein
VFLQRYIPILLAIIHLWKLISYLIVNPIEILDEKMPYSVYQTEQAMDN